MATMSNVTFISIHVRRTDYPKHLSTYFNASYLDNDYFDRAITICKERYVVGSQQTSAK